MLPEAPAVFIFRCLSLNFSEVYLSARLLVNEGLALRNIWYGLSTSCYNRLFIS
jgi:hypothetical protein